MLDSMSCTACTVLVCVCVCDMWHLRIHSVVSISSQTLHNDEHWTTLTFVPVVKGESRDIWCVCVCVRACVRACVCACVCVDMHTYHGWDIAVLDMVVL